jgi:hypothetical protein
VGRNDPLAQCGQRGIGLLRHRSPQHLQVVFEVALPPARVGLRGATPTAAPPVPEFLDKRATDTKARCNCALRRGPGFQRLDDPITKVLRVWFHAHDDTRHGPYKQLQPALGIVSSFLCPRLLSTYPFVTVASHILL